MIILTILLKTAEPGRCTGSNFESERPESDVDPYKKMNKRTTIYLKGILTENGGIEYERI